MNPIEPLKAWNGLLIAAMFALVGVLAFDQFVPMPKPSKRTLSQIRTENQTRTEMDKLREDLKTGQAVIAARIWTESPDIVGALALDRATNLAKASGLNLSAFRPQKPIEEGELVRLPFVMTLEGSFAGLEKFVKNLETDANRLSVTLVQAASADGASDLVNATVGISAFIEKPKAEPAPKKTANDTEKETKNGQN